MIEQPDSATLSALGTPDTVLKDLDLTRIIDSVNDEEEKRILSAINEDFYVYPRSQGLYIIDSIDDGSIDNTYVANLHSGSTGCSCRDYLIRCTGRGISCKHIWRIRLLIRLKSLPSWKEEPYNWLVDQIYKDKEWISENIEDNSSELQRLSELEYELTKYGSERVDYKDIMKKRATIMMTASTKY